MARFILSAFSDEISPHFFMQLDSLRALRIAHMEIRGVDSKNILALTDSEATAVKRQLDAAGVKLSALGSPIGKIKITDPFDAHRDELRRALELCDMLKVRNLRMFSFFLPEGSQDRYRDEVMDRMGRMLELAEQAGVRLMHENEKGIYGDTADRCLDLLTTFEGRLGCVFDPANFVQCGQDISSALDLLADRTDYAHIKDALFTDGSVVPAGHGDGRVAEVIDRLAGRANPMYLTLEPHLQVFEGLKSLQPEELKHKYTYSDGFSAFTAATDALKDILRAQGYEEGGAGEWIK